MSAPAPAPSPPPAGAAPEPAPAPPAGAAAEPAPVELTEFFCYECESSVSLPVAAAHPMARRPPCPLCNGNFLEPGPSPFPPDEELEDPPPLPPQELLLVPEDSEGPFDLDDLEEPEDVEAMDPAEARRYIAEFIQARLDSVAAPEDIAAATAAAMSLLETHMPDGEPPAHPLAVAALPTVDVSEPDADCSICLLDLPLASLALRLPCSHLYHPWCITPWLHRRNSCPLCRSRIPVPQQYRSDLQTTITIRLTTTTRRRVRLANAAEAPVSSSPTQLAQAGTTGEGGGGPANSSDTVSSEWPTQPDTDTVMSEARDGDGDGFFD